MDRNTLFYVFGDLQSMENKMLRRINLEIIETHDSSPVIPTYVIGPNQLLVVGDIIFRLIVEDIRSNQSCKMSSPTFSK